MRRNVGDHEGRIKGKCNRKSQTSSIYGKGQRGEESDCILKDCSSSRIQNGQSKSATIWKTDEETIQEFTNEVKVTWEAWQEKKGEAQWNGEISRKENVQDLMSSWV